jgi:hypothetical protein
MVILKRKANRINFVVAIAFIIILSTSTALTRSSLGQVSPTHPFGQLQHQETPLKLWFDWSSSFIHSSSNTNNPPLKLWFGWSSFVRPSSNTHKGMTSYRASANPSSPIQIAAGKIQHETFAVHNNNVHASHTVGPLQNSIRNNIQIAAGKIQHETFAVHNNNIHASHTVGPLQNSNRNLPISIVSKSNLVRLLGPSTRNLPTISSGSGQVLPTPVYAPTYDENSHKLIVGSPVQIKLIGQQGSSNQGNRLFAVLIAAIFIAIGIATIFTRKWPRFDRNENATRRITAVIDSAHPHEKKEGAPFSPILTD